MKKNNVYRILLLLCVFFISFSLKIHAEETLIKIDFENQDLSAWKEMPQMGEKVSFTIQEEQGNHFVRTICPEQSESVFLYPIQVKVVPGTKLRWRWRMIEAKWDITNKITEWAHFPAGVYVYFGHTPGPEGGPALSYIWSTGLAIKNWDHSPNPLPHRYLTIEHGLGKKGQWIQEERDLYQDYLNAQGQEPPLATTIGIVTAVIGKDGNAVFDFDDIEIVFTNRKT